MELWPTMACVPGFPGAWLGVLRFWIEYTHLLHGGQFLLVNKAVPPAGTVTCTTRVEAVFDKGPGKGAIVYQTRDIHDAACGDLLVSVRMSAFLRADGGFGGTADGAPIGRASCRERVCQYV